jgi:flavin reductase (DIM6/NTAB) family NADH-FMN oxidoreductase RutF
MTPYAASTLEDKSQLFRSIFAQLPSGVTVLTTSDRAGEPRGMTASAVCSLSLDPLLVLACISSSSGTLAHLLDSGRFAINILGHRDAATSTRFAGRHANKFAGIQFRWVDGVPVLDAALAWLRCGVDTTYPGGDHTIVVGAVTLMNRREGEPLVWHRGHYRQLKPATHGTSLAAMNGHADHGARR